MGARRPWRTDEPGGLRGARPPAWLRWLPVAGLLALMGAQAAAPQDIELGSYYAVLGPLAAMGYGVLGTAVVACSVLVVVWLPVIGAGSLAGNDYGAVCLLGALSVVIAALRSRQEGRLVQVSTVAEAAQLAVLPPLPGSVGGIEVAALYRAATVGALVGGDLYDVRSGPYGVRALVADVQGHGLAAVGTVTGLLGAFREAALDMPDLREVADRLDRRISLDARGGELFATALLLEFPAAGAPGAAAEEAADGTSAAAPGTVRLVCRGHPPPLLLRDGRVGELPCDPGPPLGLRLPGPPPPGPTDAALLPGDLILAHTDGVTEARSADGRFYPLAERLTAWLADGTRPTPRGLVDTVWADLDAFAGAVADDVAMLALAPGTEPGDSAVPAP
jgi:hypothetical protein